MEYRILGCEGVSKFPGSLVDTETFPLDQKLDGSFVLCFTICQAKIFLGTWEVAMLDP